MFVVDLHHVDLPGLVQRQQAVRSRRDGGLRQGDLGDLLDQQGAMGSGVVDTHLPTLVDGDKAFAEILRDDLRDAALLAGEFTDVGQGVFVVLVPHRKPLGHPALGVPHQDRDAAGEKAQTGHPHAVGHDALVVDEFGGGLIRDVEIVDKPIIRDDVEVPLQDPQGQMAHPPAGDGNGRALALQGHTVVEKGFYGLNSLHQQAPIGRDRRDGRRFLGALHRDQTQGQAGRVNRQGLLSQRIDQLRRDGPLVVGKADLVFMLRHEGSAIGQPHHEDALRGVAQGRGDDRNIRGKRKPALGENSAVLDLEKDGFTRRRQP